MLTGIQTCSAVLARRSGPPSALLAARSARLTIGAAVGGERDSEGWPPRRLQRRYPTPHRAAGSDWALGSHSSRHFSSASATTARHSQHHNTAYGATPSASSGASSALAAPGADVLVAQSRGSTPATFTSIAKSRAAAPQSNIAGLARWEQRARYSSSVPEPQALSHAKVSAASSAVASSKTPSEAGVSEARASDAPERKESLEAFQTAVTQSKSSRREKTAVDKDVKSEAAVRQRRRSRYPSFWKDLQSFFSSGIPGIINSDGAKNVAKAQDPISKGARRVIKLLRRLVKNTWGAIRDPRVVGAWLVDMKDIVGHGFEWFKTGCRLFGRNVKTSYKLTLRVANGHALTIRERQLLTKTTSDCLRIVPFSLFIVIPFAELLLPFALRIFPGLMPSTFTRKTKYDDATLARKLQAKMGMAVFWQEVVAQRTQAILEFDDHEHADKAAELQAFQEKLMAGIDYPTVQEILRFSSLFNEEMKIGSMNVQQLRAMTKMLGLTPMTLPVHNQLQLRHHITSLRREDRDLLWEGTAGLTKNELIEACHKRGCHFHRVTEAEMRRELERWLEISRHRKIPMQLLLWIQSFYLSAEEEAEAEDVKPEDLQVKVEPTAAEVAVEVEPKDAFDGMEQRTKVRLENTQSRLEELEKEIQEVLTEEDTRDKGKDYREDDVTKRGEEIKKTSEVNKTAVDVGQEEKQCILRRMEALSEAQELNRDIIERQREMLRNQLTFMSKMRESVQADKTEHAKDPSRILLDQRVRLQEMMSSFSKDVNQIEDLLNNADEAFQANAPKSMSFKEGDVAWIAELFEKLDMNKDGVISRKEFGKIFTTNAMFKAVEEAAMLEMQANMNTPQQNEALVDNANRLDKAAQPDEVLVDNAHNLADDLKKDGVIADVGHSAEAAQQSATRRDSAVAP